MLDWEILSHMEGFIALGVLPAGRSTEKENVTGIKEVGLGFFFLPPLHSFPFKPAKLQSSKYTAKGAVFL